VVDKAEIGDARSIGGAKDCVREGLGGEGEKERNDVEVAGGVIGSWSDDLKDGSESDVVVIEGELCKAKLIAGNE